MRNASALFAWTKAILWGSLAGAAVTCHAVAADDTNSAPRDASQKAVQSATAAPSPSLSDAVADAGQDSQKKVARAVLAKADQLAESGQLEKAAVMARRAASYQVTWLPEERNPQQLLTELANRKGATNPKSNGQPAVPTANGALSTAGAKQVDQPSTTVIKKRRYVAALLDTARDDLLIGRLDLAHARAATARKIEIAYHFLDSRAAQLLTKIDRLRGRQPASATAVAGPVVIRAQSPGSSDAPADFSAANNASPPQVAQTGSNQSSSNLFGDKPRGENAVPNPKQQAQRLLAEARSAFEKGDYDRAREKALKADEFDVKWGVLEDTPQSLLSEIERSTGVKVFARKKTKKRTALDLSDPSRAKALALIQQARADLQAGKLDSARQKAEQAKRLNAKFGMFEDRPDTVLADVARAQRLAQPSGSTDAFTTNGSGTSPASRDQGNSKSSANSQQAQDLLLQARTDLQAGKLDAARQKVEQVAKMNVAYGPFDDRPELVSELLAKHAAPAGGNRHASGRGVAQAGAKTSNAPLQDVTENVQHAFDQQPGDIDRAASPKMSKTQVTALVQSAREDLNNGRLASARRKAKEAAALDVTYSVMEDRPELILADIDRMEVSPGPQKNRVQTANAGNRPDSGSGNEDVFDSADQPKALATMSKVGQSAQAASGTSNSAATNAPANLDAAASTTMPAKAAMNPANAFTGENPFSKGEVEHADVSVIHPSGVSADELFERGMRELRAGHTEGAYNAFLQAYHSGQQLDRYRNRQLRDFLRDLAPARSHGVRQVAAQIPVNNEPESTANPRARSTKIEIVDQQRALQFEKLRTDVLNAHFKAERLRESDPEKALGLVNEAIEKTEKSELGKDAVAPLLTLLTRSKTEIEAQQKQQQPVIAQQKKNKQVETEIDINQQYHVRVEQEFADLVEEYNKLTKQDRWAEAEMIAKQAKELDKENPVATIMFEKARIGRQVARNTDLRNRKQDGFLEQLYEVEDAATGIYGSPYTFPKNWDEITRKRKGKFGPDNKERTQPEKDIEQSLSRQVSLHFNNAPLEQVIQHVRDLADVNVVLDKIGLDEENVSSSTTVTISVDGITLRSALNLILEPLNLGYMVDNEVLLITSHRRQQGKLELRTYPVTDLVLPIPNAAPSVGFLQPGAGPQFSVPSTDMTSAAGAQPFNVGQPIGANPGLATHSGTGAQTPNRMIGVPDFDSLKHLIVSTIEPESWDESGGQGTLQSYDTTLSLVIRQTQKVHDEIRDLLQQLRRLQDLQVTIEVRLVTVDDNFFESVGVDFNFNVKDTASSSTLGLGRFGAPIFSTTGTSTGGSAATGTASTGSAATGSTGTGSTGTSSTAGTSTSTSGTATSGTTAGGFAPFTAYPFPLNTVNVKNWPSTGTIVGMDSPTTLSQDLSLPFRQGSFDIGIPQFGGFNPAAGMTMGMAILSDIEAFFFIRAAQGDTRTNVMFAPKVTLFNGQMASVSDTRTRPFVTSVTPSVGVFAVGFTPTITMLPEGVQLGVAAVVSADRRFVRLSVFPNFTEITDVYTFTFVQGGGGTQGAQGMGPGASGSSGTTGSSGFGGGTSGSFGAGIGGSPGGGGFATRSFGSGAGISGGMAGAFGVGGITGGAAASGGTAAGGGTATSGTASTSGNTQGSNLQVGNITLQQPVFERISVMTTVSVPDGGTVLLGGVKRLREGRNEAGVPILNKIPYISRLFRNTGIGRETESLMLMVTPRIIIQEEEEENLENSAGQMGP